MQESNVNIPDLPEDYDYENQRDPGGGMREVVEEYLLGNLTNIDELYEENLRAIYDAVLHIITDRQRREKEQYRQSYYTGLLSILVGGYMSRDREQFIRSVETAREHFTYWNKNNLL